MSRAVHLKKIRIRDSNSSIDCEQKCQQVYLQLCQKSVRRVSDDGSTMYPLSTIHGFRIDLHYAMLYRFKPPVWVNDAIIRAFCERLSEDFSVFRVTKIQPAIGIHSLKSRHGDRKLSLEVKEDVVRLLHDTSVAVIAIPLSFGGHGGMHGVCVIVNKQLKKVIIYDSLNAPHFKRAIVTFANEIEEIAHIEMHSSDEEWLIENSQSQQQFDGHSCVFFVCLKIFFCLKIRRQIDSDIRRDMSKHGQLTLRFQILDYILTNSTVITL